MHKKFISLKYKIIFFLVVVFSILIIGMGAISYKKASEILTSNIVNTKMDVVKQVEMNIDYMMKEVEKVSTFIIASENVRNFMKASLDIDQALLHQYDKNIYDQLGFFVIDSDFLKSINLQGNNGLKFSTDSVFTDISDNIRNETVELKGRSLWSFSKKGNKCSIYQTRSMIDYNDLSFNMGMMKIDILEKSISDLFARNNENEVGEFYLIDGEKNIISASNKELIGINFNDYYSSFTVNNKSEYEKIILDHEAYYLLYNKLENVNWMVVNMIPRKSILKELNIIKKFTIIIIFVGILLCVIFSYWVSVKLLRPLMRLTQSMIQIENEDFSMKLDIKSNDEIGVVADTFNRMSCKLDKLLNQVYKLKIKEKEAELRVLQMQINPHFLYNTLDVIYWMCRIEKAEESEKLVQALSNLFRLTLNNGKDMTTVRQEVEHIKNYIIIQQKRYDIQFITEVDEELLDCQVIKLILQPLVENAIVHGIEKKNGKGHIWVQVKIKNESLVYIVKDSGVGIDLKKMNEYLQDGEIKENKGFAIRNVNERIKLQFGKQYGIQYFNNNDGGTTVLVCQPIVRGELG